MKILFIVCWTVRQGGIYVPGTVNTSAVGLNDAPKMFMQYFL